MRESDIHHLYWTRAEWSKQRVNKLIRENPFSKVQMYIQVHRELHRYVEPVEPPVERRMSEMVLGIVRDIPKHYEPLDAVKLMRDELYDTEAEYLSNHLDRQIPFLELSARALRQRRV